METIRCVFCGDNEESAPFKEENGFTTRKCLNCGLIYLSPRPTVKEMKALYEKDAASGNSFQEHVKYSRTRELEDIYTLDLLRKYNPDSGKLLELGAGSGHFLIAARKAGYEVYATEMNDKLVAYLRERIGLPAENVENGLRAVFPRLSFDVVYHKNVISHLHDPIGTFNEINYRLRDGGVLIFETGNVADLPMFWVDFLGELSLPEHVFFLSSQNIRQLLATTGFELLEVKRHSIIAIRALMRLSGKPADSKQEDVGNKETTFRGSTENMRANVGFLSGLRSLALFALTYKLPFPCPASTPSTNIYIARKIASPTGDRK